MPHLAYYDVFKNYYANKQEERFYIMGGSTIQNATTIESEDFVGNIVLYGNDTLKCTSPSTVTITGTNVKLENIEKVKYILDSNPIYIKLRDAAGRYLWETVSEEANKVVNRTQTGFYYQASRVLQGATGQSITLKGTTENITQGTVTEAYTSSFPLTEIDDLREYILSKGRQQVRVGKDSDEKLKSLFLYPLLVSPNPEKEGTNQSIPAIVTLDMGGLCLKTYQSDLFNNWVNKEWVDGDNGINAITGVDVS